MSILSIINQIKAYYNKDGITMSISYKGYPISASGSTEEMVKKSMIELMNFVDYVEGKKLQKATIIESKIVKYA